MQVRVPSYPVLLALGIARRPVHGAGVVMVVPLQILTIQWGIQQLPRCVDPSHEWILGDVLQKECLLPRRSEAALGRPATAG
jgi:hypothetical protein